MSNPDHQLLAEFVATASQEAFAGLVRRHIDMVYSTARRTLGDTHLAEDVTQTVFALLAQKAKSLSPRVVIAGWLFNTARRVAADAARRRRRQLRREKEAAVLHPTVSPATPDPDWVDLLPRLNDAVASLRAGDRDALILRFFEKRTHAEVGAILGITEDAAKMRVSRSLQRLRERLAGQSMTAGNEAFAAILMARATLSAPPSLVAASSRLPAGAFGGAAQIAKPLTNWLGGPGIWIAAAVVVVAIIAGALRLSTASTSTSRPTQHPSVAPIVASTPPTPAPTHFNSKLQMTVLVPSPQGLSYWSPLRAGHTPSPAPLEIPAGDPICVRPDANVDRSALVKEINTQHIPGLDLGTIPAGTDLSFLRNLPSLRILAVSGPGVTDAALATMAAMPGLEELYLQESPLPSRAVTDAGVAALHTLTRLQKLDLSATSVTGTGFAALRGMNSLRSLSIGWAPVSDDGLADIANIQSLEALMLGFNHITDAGVRQLRKLVNLQSLELTGDSVTDASLTDIAALPRLRRLIMGATHLTDAGCQRLEKMASLEELHLYDMPLGDAALVPISHFSRLQKLDLSKTQVTDAGLDSLAKLTQLRTLNLLFTQVSTAGVNQLQDRLPHCEIMSQTRKVAPGSNLRIAMVGTLVRIEGDELVLDALTGYAGHTQPKRFQIIDTTKYWVDSERAGLQDLRPGMMLTCLDEASIGKMAEQSTVRATSPGLNGVVAGRNGQTLQLTVQSPGEVPRTVTVDTDGQTVVYAWISDPQRPRSFRLQKEGLDALAVGMSVKVIPQQGTASKILVQPEHTISMPRRF